MQALKREQLQAFAWNQIQALKLEQIQALTENQIITFTIDQIQEFTFIQMQNLRKEEISYFTAKLVTKINENNLHNQPSTSEYKASNSPKI